MSTILFLFVFLLVITYAFAGRQGAPWVPTRKKDVERFLKLADIKPGQKMYDLGCGDGRLVCAAASAGARAEGLELSLLPFLISLVRRLFQKNKDKIKFSFKSLWQQDLSDADLVYLFLTPYVYPQLKQKLEKELKLGTKVVAYVWPIEGWIPQRVDEVIGQPKMYLYQL